MVDNSKSKIASENFKDFELSSTMLIFLYINYKGFNLTLYIKKYKLLSFFKLIMRIISYILIVYRKYIKPNPYPP